MQYRHTDCAAIFSTNGFTKAAQRLAYAHGIYLVPVSPLKHVVEEIGREVENEDNLSINSAVHRYLESADTLKVYFGLVSKRYPAAIVSEDRIPLEMFRETDIQVVEYGYAEQDRGTGIDHFTIRLDDYRAEFQLPQYVWENYMNQGGASRMLELKEQHLSRIDIPVRDGNIRRIISFELDEQWLSEQFESRDNY